MSNHFGAILRQCRGITSRVRFARRLGLSYIFVRSPEEGIRLPSDRVLLEIAERLCLEFEQLLLAAYSDRSLALAELLERKLQCVVGLPTPPPPPTSQAPSPREACVGGERNPV